MFAITMPVTFKIGDTMNCKINGEPRQLTWRDANTLVIEPDFARTIIHHEYDGELHYFTCTDQDCDVSHYTVVTQHR
jgi:hypothetical protein